MLSPSPQPAARAPARPRQRPARARVAAFLDTVYALPCGAWVAKGAAECVRTDRVALERAQAALDGAVAAERLALVAWSVRDAAQTVGQLCACRAGDDAKQWTVAPHGAREQRRLGAACDAVQRAALAVLVRDRLSRDDFATLVAPFTTEAA